jgi:hypothetical protein
MDKSVCQNPSPTTVGSKLANYGLLGKNLSFNPNGAFVYRLGRKILILERGVRLP